MSIALLLIAHGSRQAEANADLDYLVEQLRRHGAYQPIVASFLELARPTIIEGGKKCVEDGADRVILVPYFLSAGVHVTRDLTQACEQLAARFPQVAFCLAEPFGRHPLISQIVLERAQEVREKNGWPGR